MSLSYGDILIGRYYNLALIGGSLSIWWYVAKYCGCSAEVVKKCTLKEQPHDQ